MPPHQDATIAGGFLSQPDTKSEKMPRLGGQPRKMALALSGAQLLWTLPPDGAPNEDDLPPEWCAYTGQTSQQIVHSGLREVLHPEDRRATLASIQRAVVRQQPYHLVTRLRRWDGVYEPFVMHGVPQWAAAGRLRQWVGTLTNVTTYAEALLDQESTRSRAEPGAGVETLAASETHWPSLLMEAPIQRLVAAHLVGIVMSDRDHITAANDAFLAIVGYTREDLDSGDLRWEAMTPPEYLPLADRAREEMLTRGESTPFEKEYIRKDGGRIPVLIGSALLEREPLQWVCVVVDLSVQKRLEQELAKRAASLSDANRRLDESLHIVAHELRTPLTSLKGLLDVADRRLKHDSTAMEVSAAIDVPRPESGQLEQTGSGTSGRAATAPAAASVRPLLQQASQQAARLSRLLDDLTDAARAQTGKLEVYPEPCDLRRVVQAGVAEHRQATKRSIRLQMPRKLVEVAADIGRINQVLSNYLTNAAKFSPKESPIDVSLSVENGQARVAVADRGQGLTPEARTRIWERFHQANSVPTGGTARSAAGLGLGLYISKHIIEQHGGTVNVESVPGQGSTFWFTLPLATEPDVSAPK